MKDRIISVLSALNIDEYLITESMTSSAELFFIKKKLDVKRIKDHHGFNVTVYRRFTKNDKKCLGQSFVNIYPTMTEDEIKNALSGAYLAASFVANPEYKRAAGVKEEHINMPSDLADNTFEKNCEIMTEALFAEDNRDDAFLNSAELFVTKKTIRIYNDLGCEESFSKWSVSGEFVAQCKTPQDVETYQNFDYDNLDVASLREKVKRTLEMTCARANATKAPSAGKYRLLLSGHFMATLFSYYAERSSSAYIYPGYSTFKVGTHVQGEDVKGDKVTITLKADSPYSGEGIKMIDRTLVDKGELKLIHGSSRFCSYLGIEPTGDYTAMKLECGKTSFEDMKKEPYLYVVNFSDFQLDSFTGHFGGEIRLAFLYDGEKEIPVTGGSVNGSLLEAQADIQLSSDVYKEHGYEGPFAVCLKDVNVAGV